MDKVVLDANIFLKLLKKENDSHRAKELFKSIANKIIPIRVPHVLVNEVIHVCERDKLDVESAITLLKGLIELNLSFVPVTSALIDRTVSITQEGHKKVATLLLAMACIMPSLFKKMLCLSRPTKGIMKKRSTLEI